MRGLKYEDIMPILDFMYLGETNIYQENLDTFLAIAEELKLKGLTGENNDDSNHFNSKRDTTQIKEHLPSDDKFNVYKEENINSNDNITGKEGFPDTRVMIQNHGYSEELHELDLKIKSMMAPGKQIMPNGRKAESACIVCEKEGKHSHIKDHIELHHIDGISHPCNFCEKTFRSRH